MKIVFILLLPLLAQEDPTGQLAQAEMAFAQTSRDKGAVYAFYHWLAEDAILFRPRPVNGKRHYENLKNNGSELFWRPVYVATSANGEMGLSTGPFVLQSPSGSPSFGHFLSVWEKSDGVWRVAIDDGIIHEPYAEKDWPAEVDHGPRPVAAATSSPSRVDLLARDRACAQAVDWDYKNVYYFRLGYPGWKDAGYEVKTGLSQ